MFFQAFSRSERNADAHQLALGDNKLHPLRGILAEEPGDDDGQEGELDARALASESGRRNVDLDSFACNYQDHPVTRRDESDITAVELAPLHHELAVDLLRWFVDFATEKH